MVLLTAASLQMKGWRMQCLDLHLAARPLAGTLSCLLLNGMKKPLLHLLTQRRPESNLQTGHLVQSHRTSCWSPQTEAAASYLTHLRRHRWFEASGYFHGCLIDLREDYIIKDEAMESPVVILMQAGGTQFLVLAWSSQYDLDLTAEHCRASASCPYHLQLNYVYAFA